MLSRTPADQTVRENCLKPEQSFLVSAPAGSGKTSLLTQRALCLLARVENPESVLCITFTRKAAAEMRHRVVSALSLAQHSEQPENTNDAETWALARAVLQQDQRYNWRLLDNPGRLKITTIDGLCRSITNQLPIDSGLGLAMENLDIPEPAYRQAARETIRWLDKTNSPYSNALQYLLKELDGDTARLEKLFYQLLVKRDQWLQPLMTGRDSRAWLQDNIRKLVVDQLAVCEKSLRPFASDIVQLAAFCGKNLRDEGSDSAIADLHQLHSLPTATEKDLAQWQAIAELFLTKTGDFRKKLDKRQGLPAGKTKAEKEAIAPFKTLALECLAALNAVEGLDQQLALITILPQAQYTDRAWQFLEQLTLLLPLLVGHLKSHFSQINAVDFIEISQAAVHALSSEEITDVLLRLDYQIQHILADEFQDTSQIQLQLLNQLTSGWQPGDGRTLFLVGDGMQSCYGFRGAEVGLFLEVKENGLGQSTLSAQALNTNFRSQYGVVDWVNRTFTQAFPAQDDIARGAVAYSPAVCFQQQTNHSDLAVNCYALVEEKETNGERLFEAHQVANIIKATHQQFPDDSIAVLVRSRNHLKTITQVLQGEGLTPQATDIEPLANRQVIIDLLSLTRAFLNPADKLAWFAFLHSPWLGLSPNDMLVFNQALNISDNKELLPLEWLLLNNCAQLKLDDPTQQRFVIVQNLVQQAWRERRRKTLRIWLQGIWHSLGGPAAVNEASDLDNAEAFWQLLDKHDAGGFIRDWQVFLLDIDQLYAAPAADADSRLQVMTIHKSKGLEFDHVIVPGLDKSSKADDRELLLWQTRVNHDGEELLLMAPIDDIANPEKNSLYEFLRNENSVKNRYESVRLLYVACTRAIKKLHLLAQLSWDDKQEAPKAPSANTLLASIWPSFSQDMQVLSEQSVEASSFTANIALNNPTVPENWHKVRRLDMALPVGIEANDLLADYRGREFNIENNIPDFSSYENLLARAQGTALHQLLELIAHRGIENWSVEQIDEQLDLVITWLKSLGVLEPRPVGKRIIKYARDLWYSDSGRWLLSNQHDQAACELPVLDYETDQLYVIDRTFVDAGTRWIVDYKTSQPMADESLEDFLARETEHYRDQLTNYQRLFEAMEPNPIKLALFFPAIDCLHVITGNS